MKKNYTQINAQTVDRWVEEGWEWGKPITHEAFVKAKQGRWQVVLTPQIPVEPSWFVPYLQKGRLEGVDILGLASGGGQQMPVFAALGAKVTVLDYSQKQLDQEALVAHREGYDIQMVRGDMTKRLPFEGESFDIIFHPVSNCYIEKVDPLWRECYRLLRPGGLLLAGMDTGLNYLFYEEEGEKELKGKHPLPYNPLQNEALLRRDIAKGEGVQFSHSLEEQIGGQLKAGFRLTHLLEDRDRTGLVKDYVPQYLLTRSVKE